MNTRLRSRQKAFSSSFARVGEVAEAEDHRPAVSGKAPKVPQTERVRTKLLLLRGKPPWQKKQKLTMKVVKARMLDMAKALNGKGLEVLRVLQRGAAGNVRSSRQHEYWNLLV
mmetsp:Transcript_10178/g.19545  ORF Transcript_10178/g.19545 Transcript_10178/m.19545 type:complete len:113 (+) Transcript_10178:816-1154(+)